jgi:uncharacterized protein (DUF2461 family)
MVARVRLIHKVVRQALDNATIQIPNMASSLVGTKTITVNGNSARATGV